MLDRSDPLEIPSWSRRDGTGSPACAGARCACSGRGLVIEFVPAEPEPTFSHPHTES
jgi:hypothetical protein